MQIERLEQIIAQTQKLITEDKEWEERYDRLADTMLQHKELAQKIFRRCKRYRGLQFYLVPVITNQHEVFNIIVKYQGQTIATAHATEDNKIMLSTDEYNNVNKSDFGYENRLSNKEWESKEALDFLEYFDKGVTRKKKGNEKARIESLIMKEISKRLPGRIPTGNVPIEFEGMPYIIETNTKQPITSLVRTRLWKPAIIEVTNPTKNGADIEETLEQVIKKTVFLNQLLNSKSGEKWYSLMEYRRFTTNTKDNYCLYCNIKQNNT